MKRLSGFVFVMACTLASVNADIDAMDPVVAYLQKLPVGASHYSYEMWIEELGSDNKWERVARKKIVKSNEMIKLESMTADDLLSSLQYHVTSWNGVKTVSLMCSKQRTTNFDFDSEIKGRWVGAISAGSIAKINPFDEVFSGFLPGESLLQVLEKVRSGSASMDIKPEKDGGKTLIINNNLEIQLDAAGNMSRRTEYLYGVDNKRIARTEIEIEEFFSSNGCRLPKTVVYVERNTRGEIIVHQKLKIIPETASIGQPVDKNVFEIRIPVGSLITDSILNTSYTVSGLESNIMPVQDFEKQLDELLDQSESAK